MESSVLLTYRNASDQRAFETGSMRMTIKLDCLRGNLWIGEDEMGLQYI